MTLQLTAEAKKARFKSFVFLFLMILGSIGLDQVTKVHSASTLMTWQHETDLNLYKSYRVPVFELGDKTPGDNTKQFLTFGFNYVRNPGAAWGALAGLPDGFRVPFFYLVTIIAVVIITLYIRSTPVEHRLAIFSLGLILSGAIGNFIDRLRLNYVIDWIDVRWNILGWRYDFPNFNFADSCITVGVALLVFDMMVLETLRKKRESKQTTVQPA